MYGAPIAAGYFIAGNNLPDPLPNPSGAAPYIAWPMPDWMPQQVFIIEACVGYECTNGRGNLAEMEMWVDPGGKSFFSTDPPGLEANFERDISIIQHAEFPIARESLIWSNDFSACPILWNRRAGDLIMLKVAASTPLPWISIEIRFPVENTIPLPALGPGY